MNSPTGVNASPAATVRGGRKAQAAATRRRLLDAAIEAFTTRPYDAVAMADIADLAGTAHGLPFHYFGNKRGLYIAALEAAATLLFQAQQVASDGPARARIKAMLIAHFRFMYEHQALAMVLFRGGIGADPEAWQIFEDSRARSLGWICAQLGLDPARRSLRIMLRAMTGAIDEATVQWMHNTATLPLEPLVDALLDMLLSTLEATRRLDPDLDVASACNALRGDDAGLHCAAG